MKHGADSLEGLGDGFWIANVAADDFELGRQIKQIGAAGLDEQSNPAIRGLAAIVVAVQEAVNEPITEPAGSTGDKERRHLLALALEGRRFEAARLAEGISAH